MTTTRTVILASAGLAALATTTFIALHLHLPVAELFEYGTGTLVTAGLVAMMIGAEGPGRRPTAHRTEAPANRRCGQALPQTFAHVT